MSETTLREQALIIERVQAWVDAEHPPVGNAWDRGYDAAVSEVRAVLAPRLNR